MINFTNEKIDKNSTLYKCLLLEAENLNLQLEYQKSQKQTLVIWANNLTEGIDTFEKNTDVNDLLSIIENLKKNMSNVNVNIDLISGLIDLLSKLLRNIDTDYNIVDSLSKYNFECIQKQKLVLENGIALESFFQQLYKYSSFDTPTYLDDCPSSPINAPIENIMPTKQPATSFEELEDNNILLISEMENNVILPYKIDDLKRLLAKSSNKYTDIYDLIKNKYVVPLNRYKNSSVARFRETFSLMKHKEKANFLKALDLALELTFKYNLHPAIISACKNLDELDIYLDCLEENELHKFNIFEIRFEFLPTKR